VRGESGKSFRTFRRSVIAPAIEYHSDENNRFEFKLFEMSPHLIDYQNYFLLFLTLILDEKLTGKSDDATRIYELGEVARNGLMAFDVEYKLFELLGSARKTLKPLGFDISSLYKVDMMISKKRTLADDLITIYENSQFDGVFSYLSKLLH